MDLNEPGEDRATIGHNSQHFTIEGLVSHAADLVAEELQTHKPRIAELTASASRAKIENAENAKAVTDLIGMFQQVLRRIDRSHEHLKEPYLTAGRVVDNGANEMRDEIEGEITRLRGMLTTFQQAEAAKIAAVRAAERAAEAADPEPTMGSYDDIDRAKTTVRGRQGARAHLTKVVVIDKVDVKKLPKAFLERPKILLAIEAEAKADIRAGRPPKGVDWHHDSTSTVRTGG